MTDWDKCQDKPMIAWGEDASPDAQWSVCQDAPTLEWSVCDASPDTDWPTCQLPPDTDWPTCQLPIIYPPPDPGGPINPILATQYTVSEVLSALPYVQITQLTVSEVLAAAAPQVRIS